MSSQAAMAQTLGPAFGAIPLDLPANDPTVFGPRLKALRRVLQGRGLTHVLVYGDREHSANLQYLIGFDPRFEEALLVVDHSRHATLLVGNEGKAYAGGVAPALRTINVREFSLPGQPWHDAVPLARALADMGLDGASVGVVGWKHFEADAEDRFDVPSYVVESLRDAAGASGQLRNATALLSQAPDGLRARSGALEIAQFELSARLSVACIHRGLAAVRPGARELDVAAAIAPPALPLSMHPIVASGERVAFGIASASDRRIEHADPVMMAIGFRGALVARAGLMLRVEDATTGFGRSYLEELAKPYFQAIAAWYERLAIGVTGGDMHAAVVEAIDGRFELALNPGHLIHLEEWLDSPLRPGSPVALASGMVLQCDVIPVPPVPGMAINAEDTVALADADLRERLEREHPELWGRVQERRSTMESSMDLVLAPEVVPLSDLAGVVSPFLASLGARLQRRNGQTTLVDAS